MSPLPENDLSKFVIEPKITVRTLDTKEILGISGSEYDGIPPMPQYYHCDCYYCTKNPKGELVKMKGEVGFYNQISRNEYYLENKKKRSGHICPGHWQGYRYAIQAYSNPGDLIFDPTVGGGTSVVESINNGRNAVGIELEFPEIARDAVEFQIANKTADDDMRGEIIEGDARNSIELLEKRGYKKESVSLIINGTPYPVLGGGQSDAPERNIHDKSKKNIYYENDKNIGILKGDNYWNTVREIYQKAIYFLKPGGKFITIIKDPIQKKKPFLLHKMINDVVLDSNPEMHYHSSYFHKHIPWTYFMRTYRKRFPEVRIPIYQTAIVLEKGK